MKKLIQFLLLILVITNYANGQVTEDKVIIYIGDEKMEADLPETTEEYHNMLSVIVEMYNDLNAEYNNLEYSFNDMIDQLTPLIDTSEDISNQVQDIALKIKEDVDELIMGGVMKERFRTKFGFIANYVFNNIYEHSFSLSFVLRYKYNIMMVGPVFYSDIKDLRTSYGFNIGWGLIF